jgi:hypothetical protein
MRQQANTLKHRGISYEGVEKGIPQLEAECHVCLWKRALGV